MKTELCLALIGAVEAQTYRDQIRFECAVCTQPYTKLNVRINFHRKTIEQNCVYILFDT